MRKIPTLFLRPESGPRNQAYVTAEPHPDCAWVFAGEGIATEKLDGTNVRLTVRAGTIVRVEKRRNPTREQKALGIIEPWYVDTALSLPEDVWIKKAVEGTDTKSWPDGDHSCEALGPSIQGNPLGLDKHVCVPFDLVGNLYAYDCPMQANRDGLRTLLLTLDSRYSPGHLAEGIVFHHPDGRRAKIKRKDFEP